MATRSDSDICPNVVIPNPDPSALTNEAIDRRVANVEAVIQARLDGMEKAVEVFQADLTRVPTQLDRAVVGLRDLLESRIAGFEKELASSATTQTARSDSNLAVIGTRLAGMDKAIELLQRLSDKMPDFVRDQVGQLRDLHSEKFESVTTELQERDRRVEQKFTGIDTQFFERDKRTEQLSLADKTAIAAALQAQKEAAGATNESNGAALAKMEASFTKLIDAVGSTVASSSRNLEDKINDLKSRLDRGEGKIEVSDPAINMKLEMLARGMESLSSSRDQHSGSEKQSSDSTARMWSIVAIAVAAAVGVGEIFTRLAVH